MKEKSTHFSVAFFCLICSIALSLLPGSTYAQLATVSLTSASFNIDVVAEGTGSNPQAVTTGTLDAGTNNVFYTKAFQGANGLFIGGGGLPNSGTINNGSDTWQLQSYTANNCLYFAPQSVTSTRSLNLTTAAAFSQIALMATSGNGSCSVTIFLHFTDGTLVNYGTSSVSDWFGGTPSITAGMGRITRTNSILTAAVSGYPTDPRLYQTTINLSAGDQVKNLDRIDVQDNSTNNSTSTGFFAMSASFTILSAAMAPLQAEYTAKNNSVNLQWSAFNNTSGNVFEVQRSANGSSFATIGTLNPSPSATEQTLTFADQPSNTSSTWFYRVRETSSSGAPTISNTISVNITVTGSLRVLQTRGTMRLSGNLTAASYHFAFYNSSGQQLSSGAVSSADGYTIPDSHLPSGLYVVMIRGSGLTESIKFFKAKE